MCTTVHARCLQTTARPTRVLLYTRTTRTLPHGRHVCCCTRVPRDDRSEHARAPYTWARPPTCTPCRPPDRRPLHAPVVGLQYARALAVILHRVLYSIKNLAPQLLSPRGRCYYTCALLYTRAAYRLPHGRHVCYCTRVLLVHYRTDDTCAAVHVRHATTDRNTRALSTRGHAGPRVHRADRRIANLCAHGR